MGRTKQTPQGSASYRPAGIMAATFTRTGRGKAGPEEQFRDAPGEDTEEEFPLVLEDAEQQPKEGKPGTSKTPPRPPPTTPPRLLPQTLTKMNPQLLLSMSWSTKQQAKLG